MEVVSTADKKIPASPAGEATREILAHLKETRHQSDGVVRDGIAEICDRFGFHAQNRATIDLRRSQSICFLLIPLLNDAGTLVDAIQIDLPDWADQALEENAA